MFIQEGDISYHLCKNDMIILRPHVIHQGTQYSHGRTSFYWIHFFMENETFAAGQVATGAVIRRGFSNASIIKELMHYSLMPNSPQYVQESMLQLLLLSGKLRNILDITMSTSQE